MTNDQLRTIDIQDVNEIWLKHRNDPLRPRLHVLTSLTRQPNDLWLLEGELAAYLFPAEEVASVSIRPRRHD